MSSWMQTFGLPNLLKRSRSEDVMLTARPSLQHKPSLDLETIPEVSGESEILRLEEIIYLANQFPPRLIGTDWKLAYSTAKHGYSLGNVYRKFQAESGPTLLCILSTTGEVYGALVSQPLRLDEHFYGTGESFLYTLRPTRQMFNWSGENQLFVQGTGDSLIVGAGDGHFGLFIDSNLYQGRSQRCATYNNEPLANPGDFVIKAFECWTFK